jgi:hypothetical protein
MYCFFTVEENLKKMLKTKNGSVFNLDSRVIRVFPTKKNPDVFQAIMEIDRLAYETVMKLGGLVVGYDHCVVYDALEVSRCFNCKDSTTLREAAPTFALVPGALCIMM